MDAILTHGISFPEGALDIEEELPEFGMTHIELAFAGGTNSMVIDSTVLNIVSPPLNPDGTPEAYVLKMLHVDNGATMDEYIAETVTAIQAGGMTVALIPGAGHEETVKGLTLVNPDIPTQDSMRNLINTALTLSGHDQLVLPRWVGNTPDITSSNQLIENNMLPIQIDLNTPIPAAPPKKKNKGINFGGTLTKTAQPTPTCVCCGSIGSNQRDVFYLPEDFSSVANRGESPKYPRAVKGRICNACIETNSMQFCNRCAVGVIATLTNTYAPSAGSRPTCAVCL